MIISEKKNKMNHAIQNVVVQDEVPCSLIDLLFLIDLVVFCMNNQMYRELLFSSMFTHLYVLVSLLDLAHLVVLVVHLGQAYLTKQHTFFMTNIRFNNVRNK